MTRVQQNIKYIPPPTTVDRSFLVDHVRILPTEQITFHQHEALEISYIIVGSGRRAVGSTIETFSHGEVVFLPSNVPHCWSFDEFTTATNGTIENISIFFSPGLLQSALACFPELQSCFLKILNFQDAVVFKGVTLTKLQQLIKTMTQETEIERFATLIRILSVIAYSDETSVVGSPVTENRNSRKLQRAYSYVINNFQIDIKLENVASFVGMEKSSFCTFFKRMTGKSFFSFLIAFRIESASQMLQNTNMSIGEICNAAGFNDVPHFNRVFKKLKQITPTQFRKV